MNKVKRNTDKPRRCPECHGVRLHDPDYSDDKCPQNGCLISSKPRPWTLLRCDPCGVVWRYGKWS